MQSQCDRTALWIYDKEIDPAAGGTERVTHLVMRGLENSGYRTAGFLVVRQESPRHIYDQDGHRIIDLYTFLHRNNVGVIVNQIGYSKWLLEEFLARGGRRWKSEGGRIVTCLHFDPLMFQTSFQELIRDWNRRTLHQKIRRLARITLLPFERHRARKTLRGAYQYLLEESDQYVILSEHHRHRLLEISATQHGSRIHSIPNPNTFSTGLPPTRLDEKQKNVLIVSRLDEPQKRVSLSLKAWSIVMSQPKFADWRLQIIGDGDYAEDYRAFISARKIPNVEMLGKRSPEQFYEQASIYLHTAAREGWGLTITEAMQKGVVPIVMHSSAVFEELICNGDDGLLCENGNVRAFATYIQHLMENPDQRRRMAARAIQSAERRRFDVVLDRWSVALYQVSPPGPHP